jgi:hypothetical protein
MARIALWASDDAPAGTTAAGGAIPADGYFAVDAGTVSVDFSPGFLRDGDDGTILARASAEPGEGFAMGVTPDGRVSVQHHCAGTGQELATPSEFFVPGEALRVCYSWDRGGDGGQFTAENLSTGVTHSEQVPENLTMDFAAESEAPWHLAPAGEGGTIWCASLYDSADIAALPNDAGVADLIVNGGFADTAEHPAQAPPQGEVDGGPIPGWTCVAPGSDDSDDLRIGQDIQGAVPGADYVLSFRASDTAGGGNGLSVYWNGAPVEVAGATVIEPPAGGFAVYSVRVTAGSGDGPDRLEFQGHGPADNHGVAIDDVRLIGPRAPEPAATEGAALSGQEMAADPLDDALDDDAPGDAPEGGEGDAADFTVTLTFEGGTASGQNTLGHYHIDPLTGQIAGVGIAFADARSEFGHGALVPGTSQAAVTVPPGAEIGVFLIADGNRLNDFEALGAGELRFVDAQGDPARLDHPAPQLVHVAPDGGQTLLSGEVWHSAGFGDSLALNTDGAVHLHGVSQNSDGTWTFAFDERAAANDAGDSESGQVIFTVDPGRSGASFLNPDFDTGDEFADNEADFAALFADEEDDEDDDQDAAHAQRSDSHDQPDFATMVAQKVFAVPGEHVEGTTGQETLVLSGQKGNVAGIEITGAATNDDGTVTKDGVVSFRDGSEDVSFSGIAKIVPCFTIGTLIETDEGRVPVEELFPGDRVLTRDRGFRDLVWVGRKDVSPELLAARPEFAAVRIARGALGDNLPDRDMLVSPQHRILMVGVRTELLFGVPEVLVAAKHLIGMPGITRAYGEPVTYVHVMCDRHEILRADGAWSESFQPGDLSLAGLDTDQRQELLALFPELAGAEGQRAYAAARLALRRYEARVLIGA